MRGRPWELVGTTNRGRRQAEAGHALRLVRLAGATALLDDPAVEASKYEQCAGACACTPADRFG